MNAMFSELMGDYLEIFMDDILVFCSNFEKCLSNLAKVIKSCIKNNLVLSWEKSHFMVQDRGGQGQNRTNQEPSPAHQSKTTYRVLGLHLLLQDIHP